MSEAVQNWRAYAECRNTDPEYFFIPGADQNEVAKFCRDCPVRYECLGFALDMRIEFGVWGGMTERQRRAMLRTHPNIWNWTAGLARRAVEHRQALGVLLETRPPDPAAVPRLGNVALEGEAETRQVEFAQQAHPTKKASIPWPPDHTEPALPPHASQATGYVL